MSLAVLNSQQSQILANVRRETDPSATIGAKEVAKRVGVVALYVLIALLHLVELPLAAITGNINRVKLNCAAIKIAFCSLHIYFMNKDNPNEGRFDFHHISYGLLFMLLPGRFLSFGKLITSCSLVNYDHFGGFGYRRNMHFRQVDGGYNLVPGRTDGSLINVSSVALPGNRHENVYPADGYFVNHTNELLGEVFGMCNDAPYLTAGIREKDRLIDQLVKPHLQRIEQDPNAVRPIFDINFDLFKEWIG